MPTRQTVLGYPIDLINKTQALAMIETAWQSLKGFLVVTLNAEMVMAAQQDAKLDRIIRKAGIVIPDGAGAVWALRLAGHKVDRLPGIELAESTLALAATKNIRVALIGGRPEITESLFSNLLQQYPKLNIVASHDGYFTAEQEADLVSQLATLKPQLLLLALGVPKQEYFADTWQSHFPETVIIGVGGSFDVWAHVVNRAPQSFQRLHLEWLYRLLKEPWRFKRMSSTLPAFALQVLFERITSFFKK